MATATKNSNQSGRPMWHGQLKALRAITSITLVHVKVRPLKSNSGNKDASSSSDLAEISCPVSFYLRRILKKKWPMTQEKKILLEELIVSTLATTDALAKLIIAKGLITDEEFKAPEHCTRSLSRRAEADELRRYVFIAIATGSLFNASLEDS